MNAYGSLLRLGLKGWLELEARCAAGAGPLALPGKGLAGRFSFLSDSLMQSNSSWGGVLPALCQLSRIA